MSKRKLNLDELQVESFVTSFESDHDGTVKGGYHIIRTIQIWCNPVPIRTIDGCFNTIACPSVVDGCPSTPGGCDFDTTTVQTLTDPIGF